MDVELAALTATAATTLVQRLTTDGWERAKSAVGALWRRAYPERSDTVEVELAETRFGALQARQEGDEQTEQDLVSEWRSRLRRLITSDPSLVDELRRLVEQWEVPSPSPGETRIGRMDMRAHASGHSRVTLAGRDAYITES